MRGDLTPELAPFEAIRQPFRIDVYQDILFVAESFEQLIEATKVLIYQIKERNSIRWTKK